MAAQSTGRFCETPQKPLDLIETTSYSIFYTYCSTAFPERDASPINFLGEHEYR